MVRVVLDANVLVSAILTPRGETANVLRAWRDEQFQLVVSTAILAEIGRVLLYPKLKKRHGWNGAIVQQFLDDLSAVSITTPGELHVTVVAEDPSDNRYVECAVEGDADVIVSGDHHLRDVGSYRGIPILSVKEFLALLGK